MRFKALLGSAALLTAAAMVRIDAAPGGKQTPGPATQGVLLTLGKEGPIAECPLKHTDVKAEISGFLARVRVTQDFENTAPDKIEAVYVFPLPHDAAVDGMTMTVGDRTVRGVIKRREEAKAYYEAARNAGKVASLLDQERPNIFTQHVANIAPGAKVRIEITYVETLRYEAGSYDWVFPMVVGPRYIPGNPIGQSGGGSAPDTDRVPDASRISPPIAAKGTRAGHDISVQVKLDAGLPLDSVASPSHDVTTDRPSSNSALVRLKEKDVLPNKDFILRYDVAGRKIQDAILTHRGAKGGFFTLMIQPPERVTPAEITPKELVFVLDTSGSMHGFPIDKAKETMRLALDGLNGQDTFNLITFAGDTSILFPQPVPATPENLTAARSFLAGRHGRGGTEMMKAIVAALAPSDSQKHVRVVCFMTDGYVGNESEILAEINRHPNARVFSFGIGGSVNRYLLAKMAEAGRGEVEYVALNDDGSAAAKRFHERIRNPLLTDISVEWNGLPVSEVYPRRIPDLFSAKPIHLTGRYSAAAKGTIRIRGKLAGSPYVRKVPVNLPAAEADHDVLGTLWARTKIDSLSHSPSADGTERITKLGLDFSLMTQFTSFVAVEEKTVIEGGQPRRVQVPVEMPENVAYEGIFGDANATMAKAAALQSPGFAGSGFGGGFGPGVYRPRGGVAGGVPSNSRTVLREALPAPFPAVVKAEKLHPALKGTAAARLAKDGKVRVQVFVKQADQATLDLLKKTGLEILTHPNGGKLIVGRIAVEKLEALSALDAVTYISPAP